MENTLLSEYGQSYGQKKYNDGDKCEFPNRTLITKSGPARGSYSNNLSLSYSVQEESEYREGEQWQVCSVYRRIESDVLPPYA